MPFRLDTPIDCILFDLQEWQIAGLPNNFLDVHL